MALGVCLLFDGRSARALRELWGRLERQGVPTLSSHTHGRHHPHLSYVVLLEWDLDAVRSAVEALPHHGPFELTFDAVAAFRRGRVSLVPGVPSGLVARQQAVVEAVRATGALVHRHYETDRWLPHSAGHAAVIRAGTSRVVSVQRGSNPAQHSRPVLSRRLPAVPRRCRTPSWCR